MVAGRAQEQKTSEEPGIEAHLPPHERVTRRTRYLAGCVCALVIALAALLALQAGERAMSDRTRELGNLALALAGQTERAFQGVELAQRAIMDTIATARIQTQEQFEAVMGRESVHRMLQDKIDALPYVDAITVVDENGRLQNFSRYWPIPPIVVSDRDYFQALLQPDNPGIAVSAPVANRATGTVTIYLGRRISASDGHFLGVLLGALRQSYFEEIFSTIDLGREAAIAMFRSDGTYLAGYPHAPAHRNETPAARAATARLLDSAEIDGITSEGLIDGRVRVYAMRRLAGYPVSILVTDSEHALMRRAWGQALPIMAFAVVICLGIAAAVVLTERRLDNQRKVAEALMAAARRDSLTELPNRLGLVENLDGRLGTAGERPDFALLFLDLDYFKSINDTLGHVVGDALLRAAAERICMVASHALIVSRLGGDEFAIVLPATDEERAIEIAGAVIEAIKQPFDLDHNRIVVGGSIGIAIAPQHGQTLEELLKNADLALHRAKADGRGQAHVFQREMERNALARRVLELDLDAAWQTGQFFVVYQPIFDCRDRRVRGFEALIRWRHPTRGVVSPAAFLPAAESIGLILPLGGWVLEEACRAALSWPEDIFISVNLSTIQFRANRVANQVAEALSATGLPPGRLELEITESALMQEGPVATEIIEGFRHQGIRIALDDFGTGYSSFAYLRTLPVDRIKIDHAFVEGLGIERQSLPVLRAMLALAKALPLETTIEGVETEEQLEILKAEGCTLVQGWYLGAAVEKEQATAMLLGEMRETH
ncbi:putative bifunctional diguanylate cyclase/phosphodiesterase [Aquabacter cavernae]|uniref:putative bifunctional diguanylate cyclase/phosphodiesterase n=1 Tax=Aquabacter cavernae TaxID=2496029 RepID=UPI000F8CD14F|nr:EAL domain-containing protein [Aquabacter cavernae]